MISVLLLTCDRAPLVARCLASLALQEEVGEPWEVVVLDTGSTDATPDLLDRWATLPGLPHAFRWARAEGRGAFATRRNQLVALAAGDRLLMTDDDCEAPPDWVRRGAALLRDHDAAGGLVLGANRLPLGRGWHPELSWTVGLSSPGSFWPDAAGVFLYPQTANLAIRRTAYEAHRFGSVQSDFGAGGGIYTNEREDSTLWLALRRAGARLRFDDDWIVFHATPIERAALRTGFRRAWRDGQAEALQRFNPAAARMAAQAIGRNVWGAAGNAVAGLLASLRPRLSPLAAPPPVMPPLVWAWRETGHILCFARHAPPKWRRSLAKPFLRGVVGGFLGQSRRAVAEGIAIFARRGERRAPPENPRVVEVHAAPFLGDLVLMEGVIRALAQQPNAPEIVLHFPPGVGHRLYKGYPHARLVAPGEYGTRPNLQAGWREARQRDAVALIPYWHQGDFRYLTHWRFGVQDIGTVSFERDVGFHRRRHYNIASRLIAKPRLHEVENLARLFQWGGLSTRPLAPNLDFLADHEAMLPHLPEGAIAVQMGSVRNEKTWSRCRWIAALEGLARATGRPLVIMSGPGEVEEAREFRKLAGVEVQLLADMPGGEGLEGLATFLRRAALYVGLCTGPKHVAYAVGCPTVTLYSDSDEVRWTPWPPEAATEAHVGVRAMPYGLTGVERAGYLPNQETLAIEPEQVVEAAVRVLGTIGHKAARE